MKQTFSIGQMVQRVAQATSSRVQRGQVISIGNGTAMVILEGGTNTIQCVSSIALRRLQYVMVERSGSEYKIVSLAGENNT